MAGKRIVNTRAVHQAEELDDLLRMHGATPLAYPCIEIRPVDDSTELDDALAHVFAGDFAWLAITSANTVHALAQWLAAPGHGLLAVEGEEFPGVSFQFPDASLETGNGKLTPSLHLPPSTRLAVVGPGTAEAALRELGLQADVMPATHRAVELAAAMPVEPGQRVLIPQSEIAAPDLAEALTAKGALVTTVTAYRTVTGSGGVDLPTLLAHGEVDALIFASSSAVEGCADRLRGQGAGNRGQGTGTREQGPEDRDQRVGLRNGKLTPDPWPLPPDLSTLNHLPVACIGPGTAKTARAFGISSPIVPEEQTLAGVVHALEMEFAARSKGLAS